MGTSAVIALFHAHNHIERMFQNYYNTKELKVKDFSVEPATKKGENYASTLHQILVELAKDGKIVHVALIQKNIPEGRVGEILKKGKYFDREIQVYDVILPRIKQILESANDFTKISPDCFGTSPGAMLLFEDLKASNYELFEHEKMINLDHALLVLMKLAKFHAASAVIYEQNPDLMDTFLEGSVSANPNRQAFVGFFTANIQSLAEEVVQWEDYEVIAAKLFGFLETIIPKTIDLFMNREDTFRVLNHGDLWIKNCMYRYSNGEPEDVLLLDYQLAHFGSPADDLNYFLYGSINENVQKDNFKFMVQYYHSILTDTLEMLNFEGRIPTLKDIHIELIEKSSRAVIAAVCSAPVIFVEPDRCTDFKGPLDQSNCGKNFRKTIFENAKYKAYIQALLKEFELSGFLD